MKGKCKEHYTKQREGVREGRSGTSFRRSIRGRGGGGGGGGGRGRGSGGGGGGRGGGRGDGRHGGSPEHVRAGGEPDEPEARNGVVTPEGRRAGRDRISPARVVEGDIDVRLVEALRDDAAGPL